MFVMCGSDPEHPEEPNNKKEDAACLKVCLKACIGTFLCKKQKRNMTAGTFLVLVVPLIFRRSLLRINKHKAGTGSIQIN
jgi:hypothetical protein